MVTTRKKIIVKVSKKKVNSKIIKKIKFKNFLKFFNMFFNENKIIECPSKCLTCVNEL